MHRSPPISAATHIAGLLCAGLLAAGCGGGSDGGDAAGGGSNAAPVASAGVDLSALAGEVVRLSGTASDADADPLVFNWRQTAGPAVTLNAAGTASPSFLAPGGSGGGSGGTPVTLTGKVSYEFVPPRMNCRGLELDNPELRPIRGATVQVLDQSPPTVLSFELTVTDGRGGSGTDTVNVLIGGVVGSVASDANGDYAIAVPANADLSVRVRAELKDPGTPGWDVEVRDNTLLTTRALADRPIYALDGSTFDSGDSGTSRNLTAETGWNSSTSSYDGPRSAAPFSILDTIYQAMQAVRAVDPDASFPPLDVFWSVNNSSAEGSGVFADDIAAGDIGTSFYAGSIDSLFLLGKADNDTEEFDDHVIAHEWGHYFEDVFSRSDSIGGSHGFGDRLDMRVAFGEGFATALSGIALEDPEYCDTQGEDQANGFRIDIEADTPSPRGWFNEFSVMALIYDLWDDSPLETLRGDMGSIGFAPIYDTMVGPQRSTAAHTSIFSFTEHLLTVAPGSQQQVSDLRNYHDINGTGVYGTDETNDANSNEPRDALPVYTVITPDGLTVEDVCSNREHDNSNANGNRLSEHRFLRMRIDVPARYEFDIVTTAETLDQLPPDDPADPRDQSDPDLYLYLDGVIQNRVVGGAEQGQSGEANRERFETPNVLQPGDYVMDVVEFRHLDEDTDRQAFPARACFDLTIRPVP